MESGQDQRNQRSESPSGEGKTQEQDFVDLLEAAGDKYWDSISIAGSVDKPALQMYVDEVTVAFRVLDSIQIPFMAGGILGNLRGLKGRIMASGFDEELRKQVKLDIEELLATYRYNIEAHRETYRSRSLTTESVMHLGGFKNMTEVFYKDNGKERELRRHIDFGCGDGEILIQLQSDMVGVIKKEMIYRVLAKLLKKMSEEGELESDPDWDEIAKNLDEGTISAVERQYRKSQFAKVIKEHIIGIDQSSPFIARLISKGIGGRHADICMTPRKLTKTTKIGAGLRGRRLFNVDVRPCEKQKESFQEYTQGFKQGWYCYLGS